MAETGENQQGLADLPLKKIVQMARVRGLQAEVTVRQEFGNSLSKPVEAVYVFPLPAEASVRAAVMTIGSRRIEAEIRKREEARKEYEEARDAGHHAALVEEERPNIFTMSVAGIEPHEEITAEVSYLAPVTWQAGGGRFSAPLVVAPRFIPGSVATGKQAGGWSPDTDQVPDASRITPPVADAVSYTADVEVELAPGFLAHVESPSHGTMVPPCEVAAGETKVIRLESLRPDRDFILTYQTASKLPNVIVDHTRFTRAGETEEFVLLQLTPGASPTSCAPLDIVMLLDRSGSMNGAKIAGLRVVALKALAGLKAQSRPVRVGIIAFDSTPEVLVPLSPIGEKHEQAVKNLQDQGGTELGPALHLAMDEFKTSGARRKDGRERCVLLVSDGQTESRKFRAAPGVRIHGIGLDTAVNDALLKDLARQTGGSTEWIYPGEDYDAAAGRLMGMVSGPVVQDLKIEGLPKGAEIVGLGDLYAERPRVIAVRLPKKINRFTVKGRGEGSQSFEFPVEVPSESTTLLGAFIWAKGRLQEVRDGKEKTKLSLRYGILGPTTAFVAVSVKEVPGEKPVRVPVPVLMPHTWDYDAVLGHAFIGAVMPAAAMNAISFGGGHAARRVSSIGLMRGSGVSLGARRATFGPDDGEPVAAVDELCAFADDGFEVGEPEPPEVPEVLPPPYEVPDGEPPDDVPSLLSLASTLLVKLQDGAGRETTDALWQILLRELEVEKGKGFKDWSEEDRTQLFAAFVELRDYSYRVEIPEVLQLEPREPAARVHWTRAREGLGHADAPR